MHALEYMNLYYNIEINLIRFLYIRAKRIIFWKNVIHFYNKYFSYNNTLNKRIILSFQNVLNKLIEDVLPRDLQNIIVRTKVTE